MEHEGSSGSHPGCSGLLLACRLCDEIGLLLFVQLVISLLSAAVLMALHVCVLLMS